MHKSFASCSLAIAMAVLALAATVSAPAHAIGGGRGAPPNLGAVDPWDYDHWDIIIEMNGLVLHEEREN